jgi:hypothetical protein
MCAFKFNILKKLGRGVPADLGKKTIRNNSDGTKDDDTLMTSNNNIYFLKEK